MSGSNATVLISSATLSGIANAIRSKKNVSTQFYPSEMAAQINNIQGTSPITVNITQSSNQTIRVSYSINSGNLTSNSTITCPSTVTLNATLTPDHHYNPGTLNHSTVVANWGDVVSFSATPALK